MSSVTTMESTSESAVPEISSRGRFLWEISCNVVLSLVFLRFAVVCGSSLLAAWRISTLLLLLKVTTDVIFYLTRRTPKDVSLSPYDWFVALAGTYSVTFFLPSAGTDLLAGQLLQALGVGLQIFAMLSLNRSIGMVAANRGIQTGGLYRFVRHPLYASYIIAYGGYVVSQHSWYNVSVFAAAVMLWVLRLLAEERFLLQSAEYREFAGRIRWRLIPYVF